MVGDEERREEGGIFIEFGRGGEGTGERAQVEEEQVRCGGESSEWRETHVVDPCLPRHTRRGDWLTPPVQCDCFSSLCLH